MTMDNGAEVLAKIPNPNAGPALYTTASEVAMRNFVSRIRHVLIEFKCTNNYLAGARSFGFSRTTYTYILLGSAQSSGG